MRHLNIDIETYSPNDISFGVYKYSESEEFEILLFSYAYDFGEVHVIDLASGETIPDDVVLDLRSPEVIKHAYNAQFEITCLNRAGYQTFVEQWRCTMIHGAYLGYPMGLAKLGKALGLTQDKMKDKAGAALIRYFSVPCKPTKKNGGRTRNLPKHDSDKWAAYITYNKQDVVTEMECYRRLSAFPVPEEVEKQWQIDIRMNATGVGIDRQLVEGALTIDEENKKSLLEEAYELTGLSNPNSRNQLLDWLNSNTNLELEKLTKDSVAAAMDSADDLAKKVLTIRKKLAKSSVSKYEMMASATGNDGRLRGTLQFYGANRTGRWAGRLLQVQNLPRNYIVNLDIARDLVRASNRVGLGLLFGDVSDTLSQLIRTAIIAKEGYTLCVADFSAIEARVIAWLSGETWRQKVFAEGGDIYCASASSMFGVPVVKHGVNGHLRQKGKVAELACIAAGQLVQTDKGLVPIENVTLDMKVFDGAQFVRHEGVIYKGKKEVINYDGLTATTDHLVWVEGKMRPIPFGYAAAGRSRLRKPAASREDIREYQNHIPGKKIRKGMESVQGLGALRELRKGRVDLFSKLNSRKVQRMSVLQSTQKNTSVVRSEIYGSQAALHESEGYQLQKLWSKGHKILVRVGARSGIVDDRKLWPTWKRNGNRPNRCKRQLRSWKSALGYTSTELSKSAKILGIRDVYDIKNCGPRHRFVVSGRLVHNCGYQGGTGALTAMGALDMGLNEEDLKDIIQRWRQASPNIVKFWYTVEKAAVYTVTTGNPMTIDHGITFRLEVDPFYGYRYMTIELPSGRKLFYPDPHIKLNNFDKEAVHFKTQLNNAWVTESTYGGKLVENITQAVARDCLALTLMRLSENGLPAIMHIHDEAVIEVPKDEASEYLDIVEKTFALPIPWAEGLVLTAAGFTNDYYMKD